LVTSGPTRSYIDSVRFLTNRSSGRMGHALALAAERLGASVVLVSGPVEERFTRLRHGKVVKVETGDEMLHACLEEIPSAQAVFATAAVADFKMPEVAAGKIRREGSLKLEMLPSVDVLAELGARKKSGQVFFGFAAEAGEGAAEFEKARDKIRRKNLDFLALNDISRRDIGFDTSENEVHLFRREGEPRRIAKTGKLELAEILLREAFSL
jgi:phosphopantothenoylcysteine decarboxylase/phosphopantothenate--cysteine ligase